MTPTPQCWAMMWYTKCGRHLHTLDDHQKHGFCDVFRGLGFPQIIWQIDMRFLFRAKRALTFTIWCLSWGQNLWNCWNMQNSSIRKLIFVQLEIIACGGEVFLHKSFGISAFIDLMLWNVSLYRDWMLVNVSLYRLNVTACQPISTPC